MSFVDNVMNSLKSEEGSFTFLIPTPTKLLVFKNCIRCSEIKEEEFFEESENVCSACCAAASRNNTKETKKPPVKTKLCKKCEEQVPEHLIQTGSYLSGFMCKYHWLIDRSPSNNVMMTRDQYFMLWNDPCHYCGSNEIDDIIKLDPTDTYNYFNCISACEICKKMKKDMMHNEFVKHCRRVYDNMFI